MRFLIVILASLFLFTSTIRAVEDPLAVSNNKFGIHIYDENDLEKAHDLVNSSGGDWGYVTVVIREDERSYERWQRAFDRMRRMHLIPIIRLATKQTTNGWEKFKSEEINNWIAFLNSLNWVTKNRYVIIGNEPNQAHEWAGEIKPAEYAKFLREASIKFKEASSDFYILQSPFDAAAPNSKTTMNEERFLREMLKAEPSVFEFIDGWASHSYPNLSKGFEAQFGQGSLRTFVWELSLLKSLGVEKKFPVFITETGWRVSSVKEISDIGVMYRRAFDEVWNDSQVVAVTPFILNYSHSLFSDFSWLEEGGAPKDFYWRVMEIPKVVGNPDQITDGKILAGLAFPIVRSSSSAHGFLIIENTGQTIWNSSDFVLTNAELLTNFNLEPKHSKLIFFKHKVPEYSGVISIDLQMVRDGKPFGNVHTSFVRVVNIGLPFKFSTPIW